MNTDPNALNIYTDGSSYQHPRTGGFAMLFVFPEFLNKEPVAICPPGYKKATNNQMEMKACAMALKESLKFEKQWQRIVIHTDSSYVCDGYKTAISFWRKNKWMRSNGAPVLNVNQWKELLKSAQDTGMSVEIWWVKGHAKNENNKMVDKLAKKSAKSATEQPLSNVNVRRKKSGKKTDAGSVKMLGQKIRIRIVDSEFLPQKITRYRYEVMSKRSPFYQQVDFIFSVQVLRVGHEFSVRVNNNQSYPQITKVYRDFTKEEKDAIK